MLVLVAAVLGLGAVLLASVRERSHEIHLLRVLGAPPSYLFYLMEMEAMLICLSGMALGGAALYMCLTLVEEALFANFGLHLSPGVLTGDSLVIVALVLLAALAVAAIPSMRVYLHARGYNE